MWEEAWKHEGPCSLSILLPSITCARGYIYRYLGKREAESTGKEDIFKRDRKKLVVSFHSYSVEQTQGWREGRVEPGPQLNKA